MDIILDTTFDNQNLPIRPFPRFYDDFTGGGGGYSTLGVTAEGRPWEYPAGQGWNQRDDGMATGSSRSDLAVVEGASADGVLEANIGFISAASHQIQFGLAFRVSDKNNYLIFAQQSTGEHVRLAEVIDGSINQLGNFLGVPRDEDTMSVEFYGPNIVCRLNGEPVITRTSSHNIGATQHGLYNLLEEGGGGPRWDWVRFTG